MKIDSILEDLHLADDFPHLKPELIHSPVVKLKQEKKTVLYKHNVFSLDEIVSNIIFDSVYRDYLDF